MPAARFNPPSHWEDWCSWGLGIWLCISPWTLRFEFEPGATEAAVVSGFLIILVEVITLSAFRAWEEWLNVLLGLWLVAAPWLIALVDGVAATNFVIVGLLVFALALYEMWRPSEEEPS